MANLVIDTKKGIAGDIFNAILLGLGADQKRMLSAMEYAGSCLGETKVSFVNSKGVVGLNIKVEDKEECLYESEAKELANKVLSEVGIEDSGIQCTFRVLDVLCEAERYVHRVFKDIPSGKHLREEAVLHEAKDILIDIVGIGVGLKELSIENIFYLDFINVGGGTVEFSHGKFPVPAPATEYILKRYDFCWRKSETSFEMATPTGVSILAGCKAERVLEIEENHIISKCFAKGTRPLPPIEAYLIAN